MEDSIIMSLDLLTRQQYLQYLPSERNLIGGEVSLSVEDKADRSNGPPNT